MLNWWDSLTFMHWRYRPEVVQRLLPAGLTVDAFDGSAWVALVPLVLRVALPGMQAPPWVGRFPETNVRTYARSADGAAGVWFFSLDAARLGAVLTARTTYRLPYFWAGMTVERSGSAISYASRRRWPGPRGAASRSVVEVGEPYQPDELGQLDHFLTARWALFSAPRSGLRHARAVHDPWPLHRARVVHLQDELVVAAGLPPPVGEPLVHYAPTIDVRIGWPARIGGDGGHDAKR